MNIYTIAVPGQPPVAVQGISIRTETSSFQIPPALPGNFSFFVSQPFIPGSQNGATNLFLFTRPSWLIPTLAMRRRFGNPNDPYCFFTITTYNQFGQPSLNFGSNPGFAYFCGSLYMTPGYTTVSRCDAIVTVDTLGNEIRINGVNGQPCPTWTTRPVNDCADTEIRCEDLSDPRGFCCVSCDSLNSKIRALI